MSDLQPPRDWQGLPDELTRRYTVPWAAVTRLRRGLNALGEVAT